MKLSDALISVCRQALVEDAKAVQLEGKKYPIKRTSRNRLRQVNFEFDGMELRGLEQNPETKSRWAQLAREGKKVMQFLIGGRYIANVVDGKATIYGKFPSANGRDDLGGKLPPLKTDALHLGFGRRGSLRRGPVLCF